MELSHMVISRPLSTTLLRTMPRQLAKFSLNKVWYFCSVSLDPVSGKVPSASLQLSIYGKVVPNQVLRIDTSYLQAFQTESLDYFKHHLYASSGAKIEAKDYRGRTPLLLAAELDRSVAASALMDLGASAKVKQLSVS